ncbi:MAG: adenine phosphoribosyltransferase [Cenarchaeum sp. SB0661_bin_35]|nr:adenine phosphoribosyltransferase [Cenarchaeum sp. SB0667_bin_13]MXY37756.1 adenine phosphoribosyltransferase [Cenarchaeum sp. SB0664_bin_35]MXZ93888.1 adenine phosphoribosyltransferase [Cenarchaeum sp. SB0666_bin_15]MYB46144.1 adenine phosphoribosyltransferase [Cenarchaeum sp. SB0662_bin_33]MYC79131.1 adenine phosphoribosyltransferase [Cenarchaeum sp. SB0661_bin_35]MYD59151.1 adenine phosphoribosyltransferase [Cenarchaeum sp. SB0678_bin_8]MYI51827.1 adenine phosphoribosyltransferase [Cena
MDLRSLISDHSDFPKKGILFHDFAPILKDPKAVSYVVDAISGLFDMDEIDVISGIESRGFIVGMALAVRHQKGFAMIRKVGKTPGTTIKTSYTLEYGSSTIEMRDDALEQGQRVLLCDDLLATGGTMKAAAELVNRTGSKVMGMAFIIELTGLNGRETIGDYNIHSLVKY